MPSDPLLTPAPWEVAAETRRLGLGRPRIDSDDLGRCWTLACLVWNIGELRAIRTTYQAIWDALPDDRYHNCGNGVCVREFLDITADLDRAEVSPSLAQTFMAARLARVRPA